MRRWLTVGVLVLTVGCSSGGSKDATEGPTTTTVDYRGAEVALRLEIQQLSDGQYGRLYETLHPAQQALISRDKFVTCYEKIDTTGKITDVNVKEHYTEPDRIPGTDQDVASVALTISYSSDGEPDTATFHEYLVDGSWRWSFGAIDQC